MTTTAQNSHRWRFHRAGGVDQVQLRDGKDIANLALLDQKLVAGLGNIYAAESLWRARLDPRLPARELAPARVKKLRAAIAAVIERATGSRYTSADRVRLDVYDREGKPCRRCRTPVERIVQAGRSTYFCPHCQDE